MDVLRLDRLPALPWKNKGGTTRTIAVEPPDAAVDAEAWRVALSDIDRPGPFSHYPGFDRLLVPLATGLRLGFDGAAPEAVGIFETIAFDGATPTVCDLTADVVGKGVQVVNLLLRRGRWTGQLSCFAGSGRLREAGGAIVLCVARGGFNLVVDGGRPVALDAGQAAVHGDAARQLAFEPYRPWSMLVAAVVRPL